MNSKKQITYLIQVAIPFLILGYLKNFWFFAPVVLILISLPFEVLRLKLIKAWQYLGDLLGKYVSPIVLSLIYYLGLSTLAFLRRLSGNDTLKLKKPAGSTLVDVDEKNLSERYDDLW